MGERTLPGSGFRVGVGVRVRVGSCRGVGKGLGLGPESKDLTASWVGAHIEWTGAQGDLIRVRVRIRATATATATARVRVG